MRLITAADDELYGLASAAGKLGWAPKLLAKLAAARTAAAPADSEPAARYAFALMAALPSLGVEFEAHSRFSDTIEALGQVLALDPENWLARYSRARLRALIPSSYGAYAVQVSGELALAQADLAYLLERQGDATDPGYFVSTHALAAVVDHLAGTRDTGRPDVVDVLRGWPRVPVGWPALNAVLCEPLATMHAGAVDPERAALGEVMAALYGEQPAVVAALSRQPVR